MIRKLRELRQQFGDLQQALARQKQDVASLCTAGVQFDRRLLENQQHIVQLHEQVDALQSRETGQHPYFDAIERARRGVEANELAYDYGLSREEAALLVRLYGSDHTT